ncbi:MAG: hypothetical protein MAG471_01209 [Acidimicrobiaceae bacterium]|nr:hypothetical protein [Acidimicrobiaceae bacterium]
MEAQRLRRFVPGDLNEAQQRVHDAITGGARAAGPSDFSLVNDDGSLAGPFNALVAAGDLGFAIQGVGEAIRFHGTLPAKARELAILLVARSWRAEFEWYAHEAVARRVGVTDEVIEAILAGEPPDLDDSKMQAAHDVTEEVLSSRTLSDSTFAVAHAALGEAQLLELVALIGYYGLLAGVLNGFAVGIPDSATPRFR